MHETELCTKCHYRILTFTKTAINMFWQVWPKNALVEMCAITVGRRNCSGEFDIPITSNNERLYGILRAGQAQSRGELCKRALV